MTTKKPKAKRVLKLTKKEKEHAGQYVSDMTWDKDIDWNHIIACEYTATKELKARYTQIIWHEQLINMKRDLLVELWKRTTIPDRIPAKNLNDIKACKNIIDILKPGHSAYGPVFYTQKSSSRTERYNGIYTSKPLKWQNKKVKNAFLFNLPSGRPWTCRYSCPGCYAMRDERQYNNVWNKRLMNLHMYIHDRENLKKTIIKQISDKAKRNKSFAVRIHESGEFFNQEYIEFWSDIIKMFPKVKFWSYTKRIDEFDFKTIRALENMNIVLSLTPDGKRNYGSLDYIKAQQKKYGGVICPCGIDDTKVCGVDCKLCQDNERVYFIEK